ncbi:MAG TPA: hypothetical protein ENJ41_03370, partial [Oceanospirillales bacterium]|nr:hypothetical protein [Oceanospirillales bacterium]
MKIFIVLLWLYASTAVADIESAKNNYNNKQYEQAYEEFSLLAQLDIKMAQNYLAQMFMKSQGVEGDLLKAYAWSVFSEGNSEEYKKLTHIIRNKLNADELQEAEQLALELKQKIAGTDNKYLTTETTANTQLFTQLVSQSHTVVPSYPREMAIKRQEGYVSFSFDIYPDGSLRDIIVEDDFPKGKFTKEALSALCHYNIAYTLDNNAETKLDKPRPGTQLVQFKLMTEDKKTTGQMQNLAEIKKQALAGNIHAKLQYAQAYDTVLNKSGDIEQEQINQWLIDASNAGNTQAHYILG